jgi:hypothetical protein
MNSTHTIAPTAVPTNSNSKTVKSKTNATQECSLQSVGQPLKQLKNYTFPKSAPASNANQLGDILDEGTPDEQYSVPTVPWSASGGQVQVWSSKAVSADFEGMQVLWSAYDALVLQDEEGDHIEEALLAWS